MPPFLRCLLFLGVLPVVAIAASPDKKVKPAAPPATVEVATFTVHTDGETRKLIVTNSPTLVRIDEPDERYSLIYDPKTEHYIGLEHGNYTWWEFSWPEVRAAVATSKRYATHLEELTQQGIMSDPSAPPSSGTNAPSATVPDNAGYVWKPTTIKKKIAGLDCIRWTGDTVSGESVEVWCYNGSLPKIEAAMNRLREINEPISLVPVRTLVPSLVFPIYDALVRGGVTPVLINWGTQDERNSFGVQGTQTAPGKIELFTVPKLYMKTTLVTMDGLIDQKQ